MIRFSAQGFLQIMSLPSCVFKMTFFEKLLTRNVISPKYNIHNCQTIQRMRLDTNREKLLFPKKAPCPTCQPIQSSKNVPPCPGCLEVGVVNLKLFLSQGEARESYDLLKKIPQIDKEHFFGLKIGRNCFLDRKSYLNDVSYCLV